MNEFIKSKRALFLLIALLLLLALASFWRVLTFGMWVDDSHLLWASLYNISTSYWYYNHPGLPLEFLLLSHIFGTHYIFWEIANIALKITAALCTGLFLFKVTKDKSTGILASIFFAVSYLGLEVVDAPIMNIAGIVAVPILLSLSYFIDVVKKQKNINLFALFLILAFVLDPGRVFSVLLILPLLFLLLKKSEQKITLNKTIFFFLLGTVCAGILFVIWFVRFEPNAQITQGVMGLMQHTSIYIGKLNRIGNLFAAIGNIFIGLFYSMHQDFQDTGYYARVFGISGLMIFTTGAISFLYFLKHNKKRFSGMVGFFILWTFIFYIPNWFSEPRAPMAAPHRYVFLSSIGFVCLVAYLLTHLKNKIYLVFFSLLFIFLNIWNANSVLAWQSTYRSQKVIDKIWGEINKIVPKGEKHDIFIFTGAQPWLSQTVQLFGADRFMLIRGYTTLEEAPIITNNEEKITNLLLRSKNPIPINHIYSWQIGNNGVIMNTTNRIRKYFRMRR